MTGSYAFLTNQCISYYNQFSVSAYQSLLIVSSCSADGINLDLVSGRTLQ